MSKKLTDRHEIALYSLYGRGEHMKMVTVFTEDDEDYTRLTEPLEVQFAYLPDEVVVPGKIDSLQAQANRVRADMTRQLADIDEEINKLRAITFQPQED
jgi:hypothetical protein